MSPAMLEPYFGKWEADVYELEAKGTVTPHKNNPKIPVKFVRNNGIRVYPFSDPPLDPAEVLRNITTAQAGGVLF